MSEFNLDLEGLIDAILNPREDFNILNLWAKKQVGHTDPLDVESEQMRDMVLEWADFFQERLRCTGGLRTLSSGLSCRDFSRYLEEARGLWKELTERDIQEVTEDDRQGKTLELRLHTLFHGFQKLECEDSSLPEEVLPRRLFFRQLGWSKREVDTKVFILSGDQPDYPRLIKALEERTFNTVQQATNQQCQHEILGTSKRPRQQCCSTKKMFSDEIHRQTMGVVKPALERKLSDALNKILRLSSRMGPSTARNRNLRESLQATLSTLSDFSSSDDYRDCLRDFVKQHSAFCLALLKHAGSIEANHSRLPGDLCNELQRLAKNMSGFALRKAENYQKVYEAFINNREALSLALDSASQGHGQSLVDNFTDNLKEMASHMRREADYWDSQSRHFRTSSDMLETYQSAANKVDNSEVRCDHHTSENSLNGEDIPRQHLELTLLAETAQKITTNLSNLQHLRPNRVQKFLLKAEPLVNLQLNKTRAYLHYVADTTQKTSTRPSTGPAKTVPEIARKASPIAKSWNRLHLKIKYGVRALALFSSKICVTASTLATELNLDLSRFSIDYREHMIVTIEIASKNLHPFLVDLELYVRGAKRNCLSLREFCTNTSSTLDKVSLL